MLKIQTEVADKIKQYGLECTITNNGESEVGYVVVKNLWQNNKTRFESKKTKLGLCENDYYSSYFSPITDVKKLNDKTIVTIGDESFFIVKFQSIIVGKTTIYHWGILKKIQEGEDVFE